MRIAAAVSHACPFDVGRLSAPGQHAAVGLLGEGRQRPRPHGVVPGKRGLQVLGGVGEAAGYPREHTEPVVRGAEIGSHPQRGVVPGVRSGEIVKDLGPLPVSDQVDSAGETHDHGPPLVVLVRRGRRVGCHPVEQVGRPVQGSGLGQAPCRDGWPGDVARARTPTAPATSVCTSMSAPAAPATGMSVPRE